MKISMNGALLSSVAHWIRALYQILYPIQLNTNTDYITFVKNLFNSLLRLAVTC